MYDELYLNFVQSPRTIQDLKNADKAENKWVYSVKKIIILTETDYENFITDLTVDRDFIREYSPLCNPEKYPLDCLFISHKKGGDGVLVAPRKGAYVGYAAYFPAS